MKISLKNISKKFKNNTIISDVNLEFESGNIYGIIGRNGSGKTILLKIICGFISPSSGQVLFDNKVLGKDLKLPESTRCLIEKPEFISSMSGYQNLKLLADIQSLIGENEIINTLKRVNLYDDKDKLYYKYSLGMKQKLGIAQVLMEDPKVIVLDEPFNGIEDISAKQIRNILKEEAKNGKIIIIASHIKEDIEQLCDKVYKIDDKKIIEM